MHDVRVYRLVEGESLYDEQKSRTDFYSSFGVGFYELAVDDIIGPGIPKLYDCDTPRPSAE
jgi:hypothetical protein